MSDAHETVAITIEEGGRTLELVVHRRVLELSPIFRDTFLMPQSKVGSSTPKTVSLPDNYSALSMFFEVLAYLVYRAPFNLRRLSNVRVLDAALSLAEKYDVEAIFETALSDLVFQNMHDRPFEGLLAAVCLGRGQLFLHTVANQDPTVHPAQWTFDQVEALGWRMWKLLIDAAIAVGWSDAAEEGDWAEVRDKLMSIGNLSGMIGPTRVRYDERV